LDRVYIERGEKGSGAAGGLPAAANAGAIIVDIERVSFHRKQVILKLVGCDDADLASKYRGSYVSIAQNQLISLKKDSYFIFDLVGCEAYAVNGELLGDLVEVLETGSNDVYVVKPRNTRGADILIPALKSVVQCVDIPNKRITVDYGFIVG
jgi:16S rRNA processing protein RimM